MKSRVLFKKFVFCIYAVYIIISILTSNAFAYNYLEISYQSNSNPINISAPQISDVYEALLDSKNDKIIILNSIVNWLLAFASICVILLIAFFGYLSNSLREKVAESKVLLSNLSLSQKKIDEVLATADFKEKLLQYESNIRLINSKLQELDEFSAMMKAKIELEEKSGYISNIQIYKNNFNNEQHPYLARMSSTDKEWLNDISKIDLRDQPIEKLQDMLEKLNEFYSKYHVDGDPFGV